MARRPGKARETGGNLRCGTLSEFGGVITHAPLASAVHLRSGYAAHLTGVISSTALRSLASTVVATGVYPNFGGIGGAGDLKTVIGALMTIVLVVAVLMIVVCAATWAVASSHGNYGAAMKARTGLLVAVGAAALDGAAIAWLNFLLGIGPTL